MYLVERTSSYKHQFILDCDFDQLKVIMTDGDRNAVQIPSFFIQAGIKPYTWSDAIESAQCIQPLKDIGQKMADCLLSMAPLSKGELGLYKQKTTFRVQNDFWDQQPDFISQQVTSVAGWKPSVHRTPRAIVFIAGHAEGAVI